MLPVALENPAHERDRESLVAPTESVARRLLPWDPFRGGPGKFLERHWTETQFLLREECQAHRSPPRSFRGTDEDSQTDQPLQFVE